MLERILPPTFSPAQLPEPASEGARLTLRYCVQCHNLSNPAMHQAEKWPAIVERMVLRMQGRGNMGALMHEMMAGVAAPAAEETRALVAYLQKHAQAALDSARYPEVDRPSARGVQARVQPMPRPSRPEAPYRRGVAARRGADAGKHGMDEPRGRLKAGSRRAAAAR